MSTGSPRQFQDPNLSLAWKAAFDYLMDVSDAKLQPIIVTISGFEGPVPPEVAAIREAIDEDLRSRSRSLTCEKIAFTIFPEQFWQPDSPIDELFGFYRRAYPRLIARAKKANSHWRHGTYFHRMIAPHDNYDMNQLEHVILRWNAGCHHGMVTQISCREVLNDQNNSPRPGFPCLQQIGLTHARDVDGNYNLWLNAFYPLQDMIERAYGNYLGLCRLGAFLAHYMRDCHFAGLNCFVGKPTRGGLTKGALGSLLHTATSAASAVTADAGSGVDK